MNPLLQKLQAYPFERLRALTADVTPNAALPHISLGLGEPAHATPQLIKEAVTAALGGLANYPATAGLPALRQACAAWVQRRYGVALDAQTQILPVNGSREALFALAQAVISPRADGRAPVVVSPNPFYQIYEGAALLAGAELALINADPVNLLACDWASAALETWQRTQLVYVCSPGNPTGAVMGLDQWAELFALSDEHGFVIASDECYSEIYFGDEPVLGGLQAADRLGRADMRNLVLLTSLSKRSNVPGMRSGFVAGDAEVLRRFLLYRTYHGSAMSPVFQHASIAAWNDEAHVVENRRLYREKFARVTPILQAAMPVQMPDAGFYLWVQVPPGCCAGSDTLFARELLSQYNVTVLPGSFLARDAHGRNPGAGRVRLALVAGVDECVEAARRMVAFVQSQQPS